MIAKSLDESPVADVDRKTLLAHLRVLAGDETAGRQSDTPGAARVREYLTRTLADLGVEPFFPGYLQPFVFKDIDGKRAQGINVIGMIRGTTHPETTVVASAHYDHLGKAPDGATYNGADDNASGVACVLELARMFSQSAPTCTIVFCFFDGEEAELEGSKAFVSRGALPREQVAVVVNVDMIARADEGLLWAAGAHHSPWLAPHLDAIAAVVDVPLVLGHDRFSLVPGENWTYESDQGAFHDAGIPWLYFGVRNHEDTHEVSDDLAGIDEHFFLECARAVALAVRHFDRIGDELRRQRWDDR